MGIFSRGIFRKPNVVVPEPPPDPGPVAESVLAARGTTPTTGNTQPPQRPLPPRPAAVPSSPQLQATPLKHTAAAAAAQAGSLTPPAAMRSKSLCQRALSPSPSRPPRHPLSPTPSCISARSGLRAAGSFTAYSSMDRSAGPSSSTSSRQPSPGPSRGPEIGGPLVSHNSWTEERPVRSTNTTPARRVLLRTSSAGAAPLSPPAAAGAAAAPRAHAAAAAPEPGGAAFLSALDSVITNASRSASEMQVARHQHTELLQQQREAFQQLMLRSKQSRASTTAAASGGGAAAATAPAPAAPSPAMYSQESTSAGGSSAASSGRTSPNGPAAAAAMAAALLQAHQHQYPPQPGPVAPSAPLWPATGPPPRPPAPPTMFTEDIQGITIQMPIGCQVIDNGPGSVTITGPLIHVELWVRSTLDVVLLKSSCVVLVRKVDGRCLVTVHRPLNKHVQQLQQEAAA